MHNYRSVDAAPKTERFGRCERILNKKQYQAVFDARLRHYGRALALHVRQRTTIQPRLGLVVSKKVSRRAVDRNRIKRCLRACFRQNKHSFAHLDCVVVVKPAGLQQTGVALQKELLQLASLVQKKC